MPSPAIERIVHDGAQPRAFMILTHGIYGSGGNWRSVARKLVGARPEWGVALLDLRGHGRSPPGEPPHTVAACAGDVVEAVATFPVNAPVAALAGHSFGGKVMLAARAALRGDRSILQTWLLDSSPSARPSTVETATHTVVAILSAIESGPATWPDRAAMVVYLQEQGVPAGVGQWFAMNLVSAGDGFQLRLDPRQLRSLLEDYFHRDAWDAVSGAPDLPGELHVVIAQKSSTLSETDRERLGVLAADDAARVHVHQVDSGHWINADAPLEMMELWRRHLPPL